MAGQMNQLAQDEQLSERLSAQQRLVDALCEPACYPHPVDHVQRIETHISTLLLAGDYAYKIKKAVALAFVDYSTLVQRRRCCEAEIRLNRRFAPRIYLGYVAIRGNIDHPLLTGQGPILEYAVKMRRFELQAQGDVRARQGLLTEDAMDELAATIAEYHSTAPRRARYRMPTTAARTRSLARSPPISRNWIPPYPVPPHPIMPRYPPRSGVV